MEGKEVRFGQAGTRHVRVGHDQHVDGVRRLLARLVHPVRRGRAAREHHAVRGHARRRGRRACTACWCSRSSRSSSRGSWSAARPSTSGKKIEPREMKLVSLYILLVPALVLVSHRRRTRDPVGARVDPQPRPARADRGALRVHVRRQQQRQRVRRPEREHDLLQHGDRLRDALRPLRARSCSRWRSPARSRRRSTCRRRSGRSRRHSVLFGGLLAGVILIVTALTYFPALSLGPIVEGLPDDRT